MTMPAGNDPRVAWRGRAIKQDFRPPQELGEHLQWEHALPPRPSEAASQRRALNNPYMSALKEVSTVVVPFEEAAQLRGRWQERFTSPGPIELELGCGAGHFLCDRADLYPERNFLGMELRYKRLAQASRRIGARGNVRFVRYHAGHLDRVFAPGEVVGVWIQFPDPWPKASQLTRRMVNPASVAALARLLPPGGFVRIKSDFLPYEGWLRACFEMPCFEVSAYLPDLRAWDLPWPNSMTGFERTFMAEGKPCFFLELTRTQAPAPERSVEEGGPPDPVEGEDAG